MPEWLDIAINWAPGRVLMAWWGRIPATKQKISDSDDPGGS
jgi:hypothetical protein